MNRGSTFESPLGHRPGIRGMIHRFSSKESELAGHARPNCPDD
jgi:hypothetical protein